jgi:dTDP-4-dehydrorhamnose reductase
MRIILIGRGQIGRALEGALVGQKLHVWQGDIDELNREEIERFRPDAIINAAGKTDLAWCEANAREAVRCNLEAPVRLYDRILAAGDIRFIQFSSGCVWDGPYRADGKPFEPYDPPSPACLYSWTKAACDAMLLARNPNNVGILRARQIYSGTADARNTLTKLTRYPGLIDTPNSMTSMTTIEKTVRHLLAESDWAGIWNVYDRGVVTPFEVGQMLSNAGLREQPHKISKKDLDAFHSPKRVDTVLYDARFEELIDPSNVQQELQSAIEELSKQYAHAD